MYPMIRMIMLALLQQPSTSTSKSACSCVHFWIAAARAPCTDMALVYRGRGAGHPVLRVGGCRRYWALLRVDLLCNDLFFGRVPGLLRVCSGRGGHARFASFLCADVFKKNVSYVPVKAARAATACLVPLLLDPGCLCLAWGWSFEGFGSGLLHFHAGCVLSLCAPASPVPFPARLCIGELEPSPPGWSSASRGCSECGRAGPCLTPSLLPTSDPVVHLSDPVLIIYMGTYTYMGTMADAHLSMP